MGKARDAQGWLIIMPADGLGRRWIDATPTLVGRLPFNAFMGPDLVEPLRERIKPPLGVTCPAVNSYTIRPSSTPSERSPWTPSV
jgi:hypothetical protein